MFAAVRGYELSLPVKAEQLREIMIDGFESIDPGNNKFIARLLENVWAFPDQIRDTPELFVDPINALAALPDDIARLVGKCILFAHDGVVYDVGTLVSTEKGTVSFNPADYAQVDLRKMNQYPYSLSRFPFAQTVMDPEVPKGYLRFRIESKPSFYEDEIRAKGLGASAIIPLVRLILPWTIMDDERLKGYQTAAAEFERQERI